MSLPCCRYWPACHVPFRPDAESLSAPRGGRWTQEHQRSGVAGRAGAGLDPFAPALFVFSNRRRDRIKILLWERTGFWLMIKRLEADRFKWPKDADVVTLSVEQLHWLLAGIDLAAMQPHPARKYLQAG